MRRSLFALILVLAMPASAVTASATTITFLPRSAIVEVSTSGGPVVPGGVVGNKTSKYGLDFSIGHDEAKFLWCCEAHPEFYAFAGVNDAGMLDMVTQIDARLVVPGTTAILGVTDYLWIEVASSEYGAVTLTTFDIFGNVLQSTTNGAPQGPHNFSTFSALVAGIAAFKITHSNPNGGFYVTQINLNSPIASAATPIPAALPLFVSSLAGLVLFSRRPFFT